MCLSSTGYFLKVNVMKTTPFKRYIMNKAEIDFFQNQGYSFVRTIAQGGYGIVFEMHSNKYNIDYAVKRIPKCFLSNSELDCLMQIDDPYIVRLYQVFYLGDFIYMVMELCQNDLFNIFTSSQQLSDEQMKKYALEMVLAIKSIHDRNIAHCDIKPANFFIDNYGRVKIGDFGLSSINGTATTCKIQKGTRLYMAPEMYVLKEYNAMKSDIWSLGVSLYYMATKQYPFNAPDQSKLEQVVNIGLFPKEQVRDKQLLGLICRCLEKNPCRRPSINDLLRIPYLKEQLPNETCCRFVLPNFHKCCKPIIKPEIKPRNSLCAFASNLQIHCFKGSKMRLINSEREIPVCIK